MFSSRLERIRALLERAGLGGICTEDSELGPHFAKQGQSWDEFVRTVNPRFRFFFIEDGRINGIAIPGVFRSYVGLTTGCMNILDVLFRLLMRSDAVFEDVDPPAHDPVLQDYLKSMFEIAEIGHQKVEIDDSFFEFIERPVESGERKDLGYRLYKTASLFLLFHELAHLARGHGGALRAQGAATFILESASSGTEIDGDTKIRQWLELEADWLATIWTMQNQPSTTDLKQAQRNLFECLFAIHVVFLVFFQADQRAKGKSASHPHPLVRLYAIANNLPDYLVRSDRYAFSAVNDASDILEKAISEAGVVSQLAGINWVRYADENVDRAADEIRALRGCAGNKLVERGNRIMNRVIKSPPYL